MISLALILSIELSSKVWIPQVFQITFNYGIKFFWKKFFCWRKLKSCELGKGWPQNLNQFYIKHYSFVYLTKNILIQWDTMLSSQVFLLQLLVDSRTISDSREAHNRQNFYNTMNVCVSRICVFSFFFDVARNFIRT